MIFSTTAPDAVGYSGSPPSSIFPAVGTPQYNQLAQAGALDASSAPAATASTAPWGALLTLGAASDPLAVLRSSSFTDASSAAASAARGVGGAERGGGGGSAGALLGMSMRAKSALHHRESQADDFY